MKKKPVRDKPIPITKKYNKNPIYSSEKYINTITGEEFFIVYGDNKTRNKVLNAIVNSPNYQPIDLRHLKYVKGSGRTHTYTSGKFISPDYNPE